MTETVPIEQFAPRIEKILSKLAEKSAKRVGKKATDMPRRFLKAALAFYPSVLRVRTGRLRKSFTPFGRITKKKYELGLRSRVDYATVQHWGFHGMVNIKAHLRKVGFRSSKTGRRLKRRGKMGVEQLARVRAHTREMDIKPKYFFRDPMKVEANKVIGELKKEIGF